MRLTRAITRSRANKPCLLRHVDDGLKSCSRSPYGSLCWSSNRWATNLMFCSAVVRVPLSISLGQRESSDGTLWCQVRDNMTGHVSASKLQLDLQHSKANPIPKLSHRKSCLMLPPHCVQASLRMLKKKKTWCVTHTWKCLHLKRHMPSLTCFQGLRRRSIRYPAPTLLFPRDDSSFPEVANVHRISLPAEPIPVPTCVLNEGQFDETCFFPWFEQLLQLSLAIRNCVPMPNPLGWHRFGARRDSRAATMMKTEAAGVPGSSATPQAPHSRLDHFQGSGTECNGSKFEMRTTLLKTRDLRKCSGR